MGRPPGTKPHNIKGMNKQHCPHDRRYILTGHIDILRISTVQTTANTHGPYWHLKNQHCRTTVNTHGPHWHCHIWRSARAEGVVSCSQDGLPHSGSADRPSYCWRLAQCSHRLCTAQSPNWALQIWVTESIGRRWNCGEREPEVSWQFKFNPLEIVLIHLRNWSHGSFVWIADQLPKDSKA